MFNTSIGPLPPPPSSSSSEVGFGPSPASGHDLNAVPVKRKRKPAGTPDPDAEVVALSPKTLLESDRYVCEICNQGFQRDQNLQMHRRRHKMPWNLLKQDGGGGKAKKRVYVCPEPTCLHHDPAHALGDLVGIKKHFRRKHSSHKQWVCERCSKGYAVQSDYKAHLKTCGTRGHSCDCGRVFSRVESFIEHQDACTVRRAVLPDHSSLTGSSLSPSNGAPLMITTNPTIVTTTKPSINLQETNSSTSSHRYGLLHSLELQLQPVLTDLHLSVGPSCTGGEVEEEEEVGQLQAERLREFAGEQLRLAAAEKALAEEARRQARRQVELAEEEFAETKRIRLQAQSELERAHALKEEAMRRIASTITQVTCPACKRQFRAAPVVAPPPPCEEMSTHSFMSSATTTMEGDD